MGSDYDMGKSRLVTRRDFLKTGALAGAALGVGGALSGSLAACGHHELGQHDSDSSSGGQGREIKIGFVTPLTGALASFGDPGRLVRRAVTAAIKDGLECGDGQAHPITIITKDTQSDTNRAAQVTGDLITNDKRRHDRGGLHAGHLRPGGRPVRGNGEPCVTNDCPWQSYFVGRNGDLRQGFKWTYQSSGAARTSSQSCSTCGPRCRPTRRSA